MNNELHKYKEDKDKQFEISEDPSDYGSKGENWAPEFVKYMKAMVTHPVYEGMPDAVKEDGKIQWEAPSNRSGGKYQYTHQKRRDWWARKAASIGISTKEDKWISRTAKQIHPIGEKPCKRCGTVLRISYSYPKSSLIKRFRNLFGEALPISEIDPIGDIVQRAYDLYGNKVLEALPRLLSTTHIKVPDFSNIDKALEWIEDEYIPQEPSVLSPGAMSNAPDRFDGFHSFNRCCRSKADKGRSAVNLKSYSTDRRVFEYWSEGDWIAADRLMGLVRSVLSNESTADGGQGPPTADHIGPLSLGFCHRPKFRLLSRTANSAKNNRMTLQDVQDLVDDESKGIKVISWHAEYIWNALKDRIKDEETALRLSKILRDNQRNAMLLLSKLFDKGGLLFLTYLLELEYANYNISFPGLRVERFITVYDSIEKTSRDTKYAIEQKSRRFRVGFESLRSYREKENRHLFIIGEDVMNTTVAKALNILSAAPLSFLELNARLNQIVFPENGIISDIEIRKTIPSISPLRLDVFEDLLGLLKNQMSNTGQVLAKMWEDDRYVRAPFELDD